MHVTHLAKDKKMATLVTKILVEKLVLKQQVHLQLITSIMSQQLSTKVAQVLQQRFFKLFGRVKPRPRDILSIDFDILKSIGLSNAKTVYIRNVCEFFIDKRLTDKKIHALGNDEIIALLTQIKGVGKWTVQMILMFGLGREDVFAEDDFGIQKAMCAIYKIDMADKKTMKLRMNTIAGKWSPYRTYACMYLWRSMDEA